MRTDDDVVQLTNSWTRCKRKTVAGAGATARELEAQILAACDAPWASVAKVALSHGINANIVLGWRKLARQGRPAEVPPPQFVPVAVVDPIRCPSRAASMWSSAVAQQRSA